MVGDPVYGDEFFDRDEIMERLETFLNEFKKGKKQNIALIGLRKIGKTSILFELMNLYKRKLLFTFI